jgi:hypothetical protein
MAIYRQVYITFWQDPFIMELTPEEKYFYLYLMTNSKTKQCGCYELPKRIMEFETGYNRETVDKLLARFIEYGKIQYDDDTSEILLLNWLKYNPVNNVNIEKCVYKEMALIKSSGLLIALKGLIRGLDTPTKKEEQEQEEEPTKEEEPKQPKIGDSYSKEFETFWNIYPRKSEKKAAYAKYKASKNKGATVNQLLQAATNYALQCKRETTDEKYIKLPATFLGPNEHWREWATREPPQPRKVLTSEDVERKRQEKLKALEG